MSLHFPDLQRTPVLFSSSLVINDQAFGCLTLTPHLQLAVLDLVRVRTSCPLSRILCRLAIQHRTTRSRSDEPSIICVHQYIEMIIGCYIPGRRQGTATRIKSISTLYCCLWMHDDVSIGEISSSSSTCSGPCFLFMRVASYGEIFQA